MLEVLLNNRVPKCLHIQDLILSGLVWSVKYNSYFRFSKELATYFLSAVHKMNQKVVDVLRSGMIETRYVSEYHKFPIDILDFLYLRGKI